MERKLICSDCNMVFRSTGLFHKHKTLFCVWGELGPLQMHGSDELLPDAPECVDPTNTKTPELLVQERGQRRNMTGGRNADVKPTSGRAEDEPAAGRTGSAALKDLTEQFQKLRMSIEENLANWSNRPADAEVRGNQLRHRERLEVMKDMATLHQRQLDLIHANGQQLEQERDELDHQISILSKQSSTTHLEKLLEELREQEERNEETLQQLAEHLHVLRAPAAADQLDPRKNQINQDELISSCDDDDAVVSAQARDLWQTYMESGGSDPAIMAQMIELQVEAQSLEKQPAAAGTQTIPPRHSLSCRLLAVEQENRILEEEIFRIQLAREQRHNSGSGAISRLEQIQRDSLLQISSLQAEMERTTAPLSPRGPPPHPLPLQAKTHTPLAPVQVGSFFSSPLGGSRMDSLGPAPYDPTAGFVVFYDLVLGLDVLHKVFQLAASLYLDDQEVASLPPLPPVRRLPGASLLHTHSLASGNSAVLSVKHFVPRVQPSPSLSLVVEVQAAQAPDVWIHQVAELENCGWTRLELFDQYNQLRSGHWRAPVRRLPIRPSLNTAELNSVPQVGSMELWLRLVNGRDTAAQTLAPPNPTSSHRYKYPPATSSLAVDPSPAAEWPPQEASQP